MDRPDTSRRAWVVGLMVVLMVAILVRLPVWLFYGPVPGNDTESYMIVAHMIRNAGFAGYDALRTPGYPLFMLACGMDPQVIWMAQSAMGVIAAALAFMVVLRLTRSPAPSLLAGLSVALATNLAFFEPMLQSETLALLLITLGCWLAQRAYEDESRPVGVAMLAGFVFALAALVRPLYFVIGPLATMGIAFLPGPRHWRIAVSLLTPVVAAYLSLSAFNHQKVGYFGATTHLGLHLFNHTIAFAGSASDRHAEVREIAVRQWDAHRDKLAANDDNRAFIRGYATEEIQERFNMNAVELCRLLQGFSVDAIRRNPPAYVRSVAVSWARFWRVPLVMYPEPFRSPFVERVYAALWWPVKLWWLALNGAFLVLGVPLAMRLRRPTPETVCLLSLWCMVLCSSMVQALIERSDNARYWIPTAPLVAVFVFAALDMLRRERKPAA